jgi:Outer membrane protein beta-barrel domain
MRNMLLFAAVFCCAALAQAQKGFELGVNFTPANTWILNDEDFAEDQDQDFRGTFGYNVGITAGMNLTDGFGLTTGILISKQGQNYITAYDGVAKADQNTFSRNLSYIRVPILVKVNGSLEASSSSFFRIGPYFDFLRSATFSYDDKSAFNLDQDKTNMNPYTVPVLGGTYDKIYSKSVIGLMIEMGGQVNITEEAKMIFALQLTGNFTNTEGKDSPLFFPASGTIGNYTRGNAYNVSGGLTVGFNYVVPMGK